MGCLKCGRQTQPQQVFCPECLKIMAENPVKPDTPVHLYRRESTIKRAPIIKQVKPEEQIDKLRRTVRRLRVALSVLAFVFVITTTILGCLLYRSQSAPAIGQNYNTVNTASSEPSSDGK